MAIGYFLIDPRNNAIRYVGITTRDLNLRLSLHVQSANRSSTIKSIHKNNWIKLVLADGSFPVIVQQVIFDTLQEALLWEITTIAQLRNAGHDLTNATNGGEGNQGWSPTQETRRKMALAKLGKQGNHRKPHSEATRQRLRKAQTGKIHSAETRAKMSASGIGKHKGSMSIKTRELLSRALKGKPWSAVRRLAQQQRMGV